MPCTVVTIRREGALHYCSRQGTKTQQRQRAAPWQDGNDVEHFRARTPQRRGFLVQSRADSGGGLPHAARLPCLAGRQTLAAPSGEMRGTSHYHEAHVPPARGGPRWASGAHCGPARREAPRPKKPARARRAGCMRANHYGCDPLSPRPPPPPCPSSCPQRPRSRSSGCPWPSGASASCTRPSTH